jgi:hypothetical protein
MRLAWRLVAVLLALLAAGCVTGGRVKVVVHGESFRVNSRQFHRETGAAGWRPQREAARSQLEQLVLPLILDAGYDGVDLQLDTQQSEWLPDLQRWYSPFLTETAAFDGEAGLGAETHEALLFVRADLIAKPLLRCALVRANRSLLLFTFREWHKPDGGSDFLDQVGYPPVHRVADALTWIPRRLYARIPKAGCLVGNHEAVLCARDRMGIDPAETGFLLPGEQHDADPLKDANPLYTLAARVEGAEDNSSVALDWSSLCDDV